MPTKEEIISNLKSLMHDAQEAEDRELLAFAKMHQAGAVQIMPVNKAFFAGTPRLMLDSKSYERMIFLVSRENGADVDPDKKSSG